MSPPELLDCEVIVRTRPRARGPYPVLALTPDGPGWGELRLEPQDAKLKKLVQLASDEGPDLEHRQELGRLLFTRVFPPKTLGPLWKGTRGRMSNPAKNLRLRLWIEPPEIAALPWELLADGEFLATGGNVFLSRYLPGIEPAYLPAPSPLRVLVVVCDPDPQTKLDPVPDAQVKKLTDDLTALGAAPTVCRNVNLSAVIAELRKGANVLHYLGHGTADELIWVGPDGQPAGVTADRLRQAVLGESALRLVVLSACNSAQAGAGRLFSGVGPALVGSGVPAVVAMQYPFVTQPTAAAFNAAFYEALLGGAAIDEAVNHGRKALSASEGLLSQRDWSTPVCYLGTRSARALGLRPESAPAEARDLDAVRLAAEASPGARAALGRLTAQVRDVVGRLDGVLAGLRLQRALRQAAEVWEAPAALADAAEREGRFATGSELQQVQATWRAARTGEAWVEIQKQREATPDESARGWFAPLAKAAGELDRELQKASPAKALVPGQVLAVRAALREAHTRVRAATEGGTEAATAAARQTLGGMVEG
jgi:hypothetical protein